MLSLWKYIFFFHITIWRIAISFFEKKNYSITSLKVKFIYSEKAKKFCEIFTLLLLTTVHCVRGQSGFFNLAQTEGNMQIKFDLKLSVHLLGVEIWLLSFKFNSGLMGWPPQPPRERVLKINKIVDFWWYISNWETKIGLFGAMVDGNWKLKTQ